MAEKDIKNLLNFIESPNLKAIISHSKNILSNKDENILALTNRVDDLEKRVLECEKYSSKDCIKLTNIPLQKSNVPLAAQVCSFFEKHLFYLTHPGKACLVRGKWKDSVSPPPYCFKVFVFWRINEIYGRKSWLASQVNPINGGSFYMNERLPPQLAIKKNAEKFGLITTTKMPRQSLHKTR